MQQVEFWNLPAFGEVVAITHPGPKRAMDMRGQMGRFLYCQSWTNKVSYVLVPNSMGGNLVKHGLHPVQLQRQEHLVQNLFERPEEAAPTLQQWMTIQDPNGEHLWLRKDGVTRKSPPYMVSTMDWPKEPDDFDLVDIEE